MQMIESGDVNTPVNFGAFEHEGIYEYTTKASGLEFEFKVTKDGSEVKIYILKQPGYRGRSTDGHSTHRLGNGTSESPFHICTNPNSPPTNVSDALSWLVMWAEGTDHYINSGNFRQNRP